MFSGSVDWLWLLKVETGVCSQSTLTGVPLECGIWTDGSPQALVLMAKIGSYAYVWLYGQEVGWSLTVPILFSLTVRRQSVVVLG